MTMETVSPLVVVIAGPNGAGKSTTAPHLLRDALAVSEFVNADAIAQGISAFRPESVAMDAGRVMLQRLQSLATARESFAFETTLASRSFAPRIIDLRSQGFRAHLAFLSLPNVDLAVARVAERVAQGGHSVPEDVIRRRFVRGLANFFFLYTPLVDSWQLFDNSDVAGPRLLADGKRREGPAIHDSESWHRLREMAQ